MKGLKTLDVVVWTLLAIGGVNWGLIGLFGINLVAALFGEMTLVSRLVYALVGLAALYEIFGVKAIAHRWHMRYGGQPAV